MLQLIILHFVGLFERVDRSEFGSSLLKNLSKANLRMLTEVKGLANSPLRKFGEVSQQLKRKKKRSVYRPMHATDVLMANDQCKGGSTELTNESRRKRIRTLAETRVAFDWPETSRTKECNDLKMLTTNLKPTS